METKNRVSLTRKKILSLFGLIVFSLAFIFACFKNALPLGKTIVCTFGIISYPLFIVFSLVELAKFLGLTYKRSSKETFYILAILFSFMFVIHSISTYSGLNQVVGIKTLKPYLDYNYSEKITLLGSVGSVFAGLISMLLGAMGTIIVFVISLTLFIGLFIDYQNYGRFERKPEKVKKPVEQKENTDSVANTQETNYSFEQSSDNVFATIETTEEEINGNLPDEDYNLNFNTEDVLGEISSEETNNLQNTEDFDFDRNESRKQFMSATFGNVTIEPREDVEENRIEQFTTEPEFVKTESSKNEFETNFDKFGTDFKFTEEENNGFDDDNNNIKIDAGLAEILNKHEDDNVETPNLGFEEKNNFSNGFAREPIEAMPVRDVQKPNFEIPKSPSIEDVSVRNKGIMTNIPPVKSDVVVPQKTINTRYTDNIAMRGVRYNPPPLSLLRTPVPDNGNYSEEQARKSKQLEDVLESFNIPAKVVNIVRGPKITRYELSVPLGVPVKKIPNYELDIQRSLAAKTITIKAPIPGSPYVGIELENDVYTSVYERELLESPVFQNSKDPLPIAIGKDISGEIVVKSLAKMVHLLIAGSTGSGKSVFIHNIIISLIFKYSPENLRLVLIDPKKVEFNIYNGLPHLITPEVVMGSEKAINALKWCVKEMDRRYDMMSKAGYNNIEPYNKSELVKAGQFEHLPYIVIVVDELAEIMVANKKESEVCIQRITQLARACGMHLILATQRPSVDIISGVIKNNVPSRIAFSLQSGIDSKTILNAVGAEKLLGQGDMIFAPTGTSATPRLQAAFATDDEIRAIIDYDIKNNESNYDNEIERKFDGEGLSSDENVETGFSGGDAMPPKEKVDDYFKTALKIVMMNGGASVSYLQRRLSIGYSRAARIVDQMEEKGYIAAPTGSKLRKVLITPEQFKEEFGEDYNT